VFSFFKRKKNGVNLAVCLVVIALLGIGCAGPTLQGWSGFTGEDGILYFGGIDGRVFAISLEARSQNLNFPSENEWVFTIPRTGTPGTICGPACAPSTPQQSIYATPVVVADLVCVSTYSGETGRVVAINRLSPGFTDGVPQRSKGEWTYPGGGFGSLGAVVGTPVVVDDTLYVGTSNGYLYALDTVYGERKWEFNTGAKIWTSPVVDDGVIYISNYEKKLFAVSIDDGTQIWSTELPSSIASSPAVSTDNIFVGTFDNRLYAVDRATGNIKWDFQGGNWFWSRPVVKGDTVYAGCLDHNIYAIDATTGKELWRFPTDGQIASEPVLAASLLVVASNILDSKSGEIYILDTNNNGQEKSVVSVSGEVMAPLYAQGDMVYVHASNFTVYGLDIQKGAKIWEFPYSNIK
jgi:outer membrane protein assembly factor BamB